jgi:hypothetical protein
MAVCSRPGAPAAAEVLGQGTKDGELPEGLALLIAIALKHGIAPKTRPKLFESLHLQAEDGVAVNPALAVEGPANLGQAPQIYAGFGGPRHFCYAQMQQITVAPATGKIWARLLRQRRCSSVEGVEQEDLSSQVIRRPACESTKVGQIADPPAPSRS